MTMFDLAIVAVALTVGVFGAFFLMPGLGRAWEWFRDAGSPLAMFDEACFAFLRWNAQLSRARTYQSRHAVTGGR